MTRIGVLGAGSWGASGVVEALALVYRAQRATLLAAGLSEALLGRVIGGVVGAGAARRPRPLHHPVRRRGGGEVGH